MSLFDYANTGGTGDIHLAKGIPPVWIHRFRIWEAPDLEPLQDLEFRRGLNVVLAPDSSSEPNRTGAAIGHAAGKTLFCRFIRYLLGEHVPATDTVRRALLEKCPKAYVGGEILLEGKRWSVLRSLGNENRHVASSELSLTELLLGQGEQGSYIEFVKQMESGLIPASLHSLFQDYTQAPYAWYFALAWMARDQECRLSHPLEWRSVDSDAKSPVRSRDLGRTDLYAATRLLLKLGSDEERRIEATLSEHESAKRKEEEALSDLKKQIEQTRVKAAELCGIEPGSMMTGPLALVALRQKMPPAKSRGVIRLVSQEERELEHIGKELVSIGESLGKLEREIEDIPGLIRLHQRLLKHRHNDIPLLVRDDYLKDQPVCPACDVAIDEAKVRGCMLSKQPTQIDKLKERKAACLEDIEAEKMQLENLKSRKVEAEQERGQWIKKRTQLGIRQEELKLQIQANQDSQISAVQAQGRIEELSDLYGKLDSTETEIRKLGTRIENLKSQRDKRRGDERKLTKLLKSRFNEAVRGILGTSAKGELQDGIRGFDLKIQMEEARSSAAFDSLKVIALDLAAMMLGAERQAYLPGLLIHDSPREADLGESLYHALFRFALKLEQVCENEVPFQYFITTTSTPPPEVCEKPYLVLQLSSGENKGRLMKRNLME